MTTQQQSDNNVLTKWQATPEDKKLFLQFTQELTDWHTSGKEPVSADRDLQYSLDLQEKRFKKHNIRKEIHFKKLEDNITSRAKVFPGDKYNRGMNVCQAVEQDDYIRTTNNEKLYSRLRYGNFYQTIIHGPNENVGEMLYNCPNCGSVSKIGTLLEGCPYCNTHFKMSDLFPKVFTSYFLENTIHEDKMKKEMWIVRIILGIGMLIYGLIKDFGPLNAGDISPLFYVLASLITAVLIGFIGGSFLWAVWTFYSTLVKAIMVLPLFFSTFGTKKKANVAMKRIDPSLNYEYLESKALSLARSIIFSEDETALIQYSGPKLDESIKNIVDIQYEGIIGVSEYRIVPGPDGSAPIISVDVNIYARNFYDKGHTLRSKKEKIRITIAHKLTGNINTSFSICRIECKSCGGSFDATKQRNCPYCGSEYHLEEDDFVVTKLEIR
ncbi:MAG: hydrogenase maturation nickel metallochaperone HypA [Lachnospiraceae bacterium]|nr:hydrogenase maturation nickel metallochaperone HypA [Lachnospiraceae bacterium]